MSTIPELQAIKFVSDNDDLFKNTAACPCNYPEEFNYIVKPGDETMIQVLKDCVPIELGANITLNGSFEDGTGIDPDDWTISDSEKIIRSNMDPYQGAWSLQWNNPVGNSTATQDTGVDFLSGEYWLLKFYTKVINPVKAYLTPLQVTVGGIDFLVTPTEEYTLIEIPILFTTNGLDQNIVFTHNSVSPAADFMLIDLVTLQKINYTQNNCELNLVYNDSFEYGQNKVTGEDPVVANFDGWDIENVDEDLTGGLEGGRGPVLNGFIDTATLQQHLSVMTSGLTYRISFWARAVNAGDVLTVIITGATDFDKSLNLSNIYQQYVYEYTAEEGDQTLLFVTDFDGIYVDEITITLLNEVNEDSFYVHDITNNVFYPAPPQIEDFEEGYNVIYDWEELFGSNTPGCFQIISEFEESNLIVNGKFSQGAGNLFTGWALTPGNGSITQSTNGGVNSSRAVILTRNSNSTFILQSILTPSTRYTISFWAKLISGTPSLTFKSDTLTFGTIALTSTLTRYTITGTTAPGDSADFLFLNATNSSALLIDNVFVSIEGEGIHYSEIFQYDKSNIVCAPEIVWYDNYPEAFGINYQSGFQNRMRIGPINFGALNYPVGEFIRELNGLETDISKAIINKQKTLNIIQAPEYIHDRLAIMCAHSNIEIYGKTTSGNIVLQELCPTPDTQYTVNTPENTSTRFSTATVILGIKGEILGEKSINCS